MATTTSTTPSTQTMGRLGTWREHMRSLKSPRSRNDYLWALFFLGPQLIGLIVFALYPLISVFVLALSSWSGFGDRSYVGLENFREQFSDRNFRASLWNTALYTLIAVPGTVIVSLLLAFAVNHAWGKMVYRVIFFLPTVTSSVAIAMVWMWMLNGDFGLVNMYLAQWFNIDAPNWFVDRTWVIPAMALVAIWSSLGFNMVLFLAGLQGIPTSYYEASALDGAGPLRRFKDITLPLLSPTTFFVTILSVIGSFQVFDIIFVISGGGPGNASRTMVFHIYDLAFVDFTFGISASAAVVLFAIIMVLTGLQFVGQRYWVNYDT